MLRKILTAIVLIPLAVVIVVFAVANRQWVTVSFDPFDSTQPAFALTLPLFGIIFILLIAGVVIGGVATWLRQSYWRSMTRRLDNEVRVLHSENAALRAKAASPAPPADTPQPPIFLPPAML